MSEARHIGDNNYIDARGNTFSLSDIKLNEAMGGGLERVRSDMFDDPLGTKEDARRFRKLDKRIDAIMNDKLERGEITEIPPVSEDDRPDDVSIEEWQAYLDWTRQ